MPRRKTAFLLLHSLPPFPGFFQTTPACYLWAISDPFKALPCLLLTSLQPCSSLMLENSCGLFLLSINNCIGRTSSEMFLLYTVFVCSCGWGFCLFACFSSFPAGFLFSHLSLAHFVEKAITNKCMKSITYSLKWLNSSAWLSMSFKHGLCKSTHSHFLGKNP